MDATVATASADSTARVWDSQSGEEIVRLNHDSVVNAVSFSPDGQLCRNSQWGQYSHECGISKAAQEIARLNHDFMC